MENKVKAAFEYVRADNALIETTARYLETARSEKALRPSTRFFARPIAGIAAALVLFAAGLCGYRLYFVADAHISMDVNPSVELSLNRFGRVISTLGFNGEGEKLLEEADLRGKQIGDAADLLVTSMESSGYLSEGGLVSVTIHTSSQGREQTLYSSLQTILTNRLQDAYLEVYTISDTVYSEAQSCHMSPAKYMAIQELQEVDTDATFEEYSHHSIEEIRRCAQEHRGNHGEGGQGRERNRARAGGHH